MYNSPPNAGMGQETRAENVIVRDIIFACARGLTSSTVLNMRTGKIEKVATNRALSNTVDKTARNMESLGAIASVTRPIEPLT